MVRADRNVGRFAPWPYQVSGRQECPPYPTGRTGIPACPGRVPSGATCLSHESKHPAHHYTAGTYLSARRAAARGTRGTKSAYYAQVSA